VTQAVECFANVSNDFASGFCSATLVYSFSNIGFAGSRVGCSTFDGTRMISVPSGRVVRGDVFLNEGAEIGTTPMKMSNRGPFEFPLT